MIELTYILRVPLRTALLTLLMFNQSFHARQLLRNEEFKNHDDFTKTMHA